MAHFRCKVWRESGTGFLPPIKYGIKAKNGKFFQLWIPHYLSDEFKLIWMPAYLEARKNAGMDFYHYFCVGYQAEGGQVSQQTAKELVRRFGHLAVWPDMPEERRERFLMDIESIE